MDSHEFNGFKAIVSCPFSEGKFQSLVKHTTPNPPTPSNPEIQAANGSAINIGKLLIQLKCSTILVEKNYIDRDYKAEFSAFYSKRFCLPEARCTRLHFFSEKLSSYGKISSLEEISQLIKVESYLGFCVVRPTEFFRIGRTVIKFVPPTKPPSIKNEYFVTCQSWYSAHLLGHEFKVLGAPFIQQDTQVGACAHAALWMVGRHMHMLGHCGEISMQHINHFAKSRQSRGRHYPAQDGLASAQMLDALHEMGLSAIYYNDFNTDKLGKRYSSRSHLIGSLIYYYIESGFPVIIGFKQHVIIAIGHALSLNKKNYKNTIERIPSFLIHDDEIQPYGEFSLGGSTIYDLKEITELIAVLPNSVHLQGEYAEALAHVMMEGFNDKDDDLTKFCIAKTDSAFSIPTKYRLRTYLIKATEFLTELQFGMNNKKVPVDVGNLLLRMELPTYVWISEIFSLPSEGQEQCVGKFIFDSTAAAWDKSVIAILMPKIIFLFDRQYLEEMPFIQPLISEWEFSPRDVRR